MRKISFPFTCLSTTVGVCVLGMFVSAVQAIGPPGQAVLFYDRITNADGDHDVDGLDIALVFSNFGLEPEDTAGAGALDPFEANLFYNPITGDVLLDQTEAPGGIITNFVLQSDGAFNAPGVAQFPFASPFFSDTPNQISNSDTLFAGMPTDVWNLGPILPPGLTRMELHNTLTLCTYVGELGSGVREFPQCIPEPSGVLLLVMGLAGLGLHVRRER